MNPNGHVSPSRTFYRLGSVGCIYYVGAQLIQEITFHLGLDASATGEAEIVQRLMPLDQFRQVLILLGFSFIPIMTAAGFGLTAIECAGRILEGYLGQTWLSGANYAAYFPIVFLSLGALAVWLWRQASSASVKGERPAVSKLRARRMVRSER